MSLFGITSRRNRTRTDTAFDAAPEIDAPSMLGNGVRPRRYDSNDSLSTQPEPSNEIPVNLETALPPSGRTVAPPNQAAQPSFDDADLLSSVVRRQANKTAPTSAPVQQESRVDGLRRQHDEAAQPAQDRNGRVKSAILNALYELGQGANDVLRSGRPVDEYGLASIAGRGIGGGAGGALNPAIDEEYKRRNRMVDLENQIQQQLEIEKQQAAIEKINAEAAYTREVKPFIAGTNADAKTKPKPFVIAGKRISYRRPEGWQGDPNDWEPYEETVDGKKLVDTSKMPDEDGILPSQKLRAVLTREQIEARKEIAKTNNQFKSAEAAKERDFRADENDKNRQVRRAFLSEQIQSRLDRNKQAGKRLAISLANVSIEADKWGVSIDEYIDALSDNGVTVVADK